MTDGDDVRAAGTGGYAYVGGLDMYYEIHGVGRPLVVLHGAYMTIDSMGPIVPSLAETRQVIAVEQQGLRGVVPKAPREIRLALAARGRSFAGGQESEDG